MATSIGNGGTARVILALETLKTWDLVAEVVSALGAERTAFSLDLAGGVPLGSLGTDPVALASEAAALGVSAVIVLDLTRVGGGGGLDQSLLRAIRQAVPDVELVVGGGIRDAGDVSIAAGAGYDAVLVGTALHTGSLSPFAIAG